MESGNAWLTRLHRVLFRRRDTRLWVLLLGGFPAFGCLSIALGTPQWTPAVQIPLAAAVWCLVGAIILRWRRHLPPDLDLQWVAPAEAECLRAAGPPPDRSLLHVRFEPDWMRRYRLDVLIDGRRVAQLPPGAAVLLPLESGEHQLAVYLDRPASTVTEIVNGVAGTYAGYRVRNRGSRAVKLEIRRETTLPVDARLVCPAVTEV